MLVFSEKKAYPTISSIVLSRKVLSNYCIDCTKPVFAICLSQRVMNSVPTYKHVCAKRSICL